MKKRGMLLANQTVKMVIAVICIGFLVYLLASIYYSNISQKNLVKAQSSMEKIKDSVASLDELGAQDVSNIVPDSWVIFSFTDKVKPQSCSGINCICICDEVFADNLIFVKDRQASECSSNGVCETFENVMKFDPIEIDEKAGTGLYIEKKGKWFSVREFNLK